VSVPEKPNGNSESSTARGISVIVPAYNEQQAITETIVQIQATLDAIGGHNEIIVVDDGSKDETATLATRAGARVVSHRSNQGYGAALKTGIRQSRRDWIGIVDADGTYPIADFARLWQFTADNDMVVGARIGKGAAIPWPRRPAKWFILKLANYLTGLRIPDLNSGLRLFRRELAERFISLYPDGFSFTTTITVAALCSCYRVEFVPIAYFKRTGSSSISPLRDFFGFVLLVVRLVTYFKPLNVFFPTSVVLCMLGLAKAIKDYIVTGAFGVGSSLVVLTGVQIGFLGLLADLVIRRTRL
jgi:glycosyltransferase involved in cell wall biosynthesis